MTPFTPRLRFHRVILTAGKAGKRHVRVAAGDEPAGDDEIRAFPRVPKRPDERGRMRQVRVHGQDVLPPRRPEAHEDRAAVARHLLIELDRWLAEPRDWDARALRDEWVRRALPLGRLTVPR